MPAPAKKRFLFFFLSKTIRPYVKIHFITETDRESVRKRKKFDKDSNYTTRLLLLFATVPTIETDAPATGFPRAGVCPKEPAAGMSPAPLVRRYVTVDTNLFSKRKKKKPNFRVCRNAKSVIIIGIFAYELDIFVSINTVRVAENIPLGRATARVYKLFGF